MTTEVKNSIKKILEGLSPIEVVIFALILLIGTTVLSVSVWYVILSFFGWIFNFDITFLQAFGVMILFMLIRKLIKK